MNSKPQNLPKRPPILVAAGVLIENNQVLLTQRKTGSHLEGTWEFPGGKVEPGEDPRDALKRELAEELGIQVDVKDPLEITFHPYPEKDVLLLFFTCTRTPTSPEPKPLDVAALEWTPPEALHQKQFPPADIAILEKVRQMLSRKATPK